MLKNETKYFNTLWIYFVDFYVLVFLLRTSLDCLVMTSKIIKFLLKFDPSGASKPKIKKWQEHHMRHQRSSVRGHHFTINV